MAWVLFQLSRSLHGAYFLYTQHPVVGAILTSLLGTVVLEIGKLLRRAWIRRRTLRAFYPASAGSNAVDLAQHVKGFFEWVRKFDEQLESIGSPNQFSVWLALHARQLRIALSALFLVGLHYLALFWLLPLVLHPIRDAIDVICVEYLLIVGSLELWQIARAPADEIVVRVQQWWTNRTGQAKALNDCRTLLLFVMPSSRSIATVLSRRDEHLAHLQAVRDLLLPLRDSPQINAAIIDAEWAIEQIRSHWPNSCSKMLSLDIPELAQVTLEDVPAEDERRNA
ncbi:MAG TPA: hypothetical protein VN634_19635 [Candidatus Limnocylindrales bacterium]|nr:hypothetical protein [Candidatus Limnocylindrales bacterium]